MLKYQVAVVEGSEERTGFLSQRFCFHANVLKKIKLRKKEKKYMKMYFMVK